jgi:molecular chaperone GrpE
MMNTEQTRATESSAAFPEDPGAVDTAAEAIPADVASGENGDAASRIAALEGEIAALQAEMARLRDERLRSLAEAENIRRRAERERDDIAKYAVAKFAKDLIDVADNLQRALDAVPTAARDGDPALSTLMEGVEATGRQLHAAFGRVGVTRIEPVDERFDPHFHQAMFEVPGTGKPNGTVVQVVQAGYMIQDRLLRPALVGLARGEPEAAV